jgi:prevent-host-death family protein
VKRVTLADAKADLGGPITQAAGGELVCIVRRGKPVAQLTVFDARRSRIESTALQAVNDAVPSQPERARDFFRGMRDGERY